MAQTRARAKQVTYKSDAAGGVTRNLHDKIGESVSVKDFGAVGDGVTDDTAAIQAAIDSGAPTIDLVGSSYNVVSCLQFTSAGQFIINGTLVFAGNQILPLTANDRLATITANNVTFENVVFDGGHKHPYSCLVLVKNNTVNCKFLNCKFTDVYCNLNPSTQTVLSQTAALRIEPYAATGFVVDQCEFSDIIKVNNGTLFPEVLGYGFIGGIYFLPEDNVSYTSPQPVPSQGVVSSCVFNVVKTLYTDRTNDDGDAIRTYRHVGGTESLFVSVRDCVFKACSKRALKFRAAGSTAHNLTVYASELTDGMIVAFDAIRCKISGVKVYAKASNPIQTLAQYNWADGLEEQEETLLENCYVQNCNVAVSMQSITPGVYISNVRIKDVYAEASLIGITLNGADATIKNVAFSDVTIIATEGSTTTAGVIGVEDSSNNLDVKFNNINLTNCALSAYGSNLTVNDVKIKITNALWTDFNSSTALFRLGQSASTNISATNVDIDALGLSTSHLNATRQHLFRVEGANNFISGINLKVPEGLSADYNHISLGGANNLYQNINYLGPSRIVLDVFAPAVNTIIRNAQRLGNAASATYFLAVLNASSTECVVQNISDFRATTLYSVLMGGLGRHVVSGVASNSSATNIVQHGGLAAVQGATRIGVSTKSYTVTNPTTDRALNVTADTVAQVAAVLGTLISDLKDLNVLR